MPSTLPGDRKKMMSKTETPGPSRAFMEKTELKQVTAQIYDYPL